MNIVVLAGGTSPERDVSLTSATGICKALRELGHNAILVDVFIGISDEISDPVKYIQEKSLVNIKDKSVDDDAPSNLDELLNLDRPGNDGFFGPNVLKLCRASDIVYLGLHGENGENGRVQAAFDLLGIKYTGSGYLGSALAMHKGVAKDIFVRNKVATPKGTSIHKNKNKKGLSDLGLKLPVIVKPCSGGSSIGMSKVNTPEEYEEALKNGFEIDDELIIEEFIEGREFDVGVIDGTALPVIEIDTNGGLYDYKTKYQAGLAVETCPAQISEELTKNMQRLAERVYKVLKLDSYARMDFLVDENYKIYCLEANTLPGMTPTSLLPQEALVIGLDYKALCSRVIEISMKKYENKA